MVLYVKNLIMYRLNKNEEDVEKRAHWHHFGNTI